MLKTRIKGLEWDRRVVVRTYPPPENCLNLLQGEYRYQLSYIKRQHDPVLRIIWRTIGELGKDNMFLSAAGIMVQNFNQYPVIWPASSKNEGCFIKYYLFKECFEEFPLRVAIRVTSRDLALPLTADRVVVLADNEWKPLKAWLLNWQGTERFIWGTNGTLYAQQKWWSKNGRVFRLMDLPRELRLLIFQQALGRFIHPATLYNRHSGQKHVTLGCWRKNNPEYDMCRSDNDWNRIQAEERYSPPNYALLRISRLVYTEALEGAWEGTRKHFISPEDLFDVLEAPNVPVRLNWLTKIQLNFCTQDYLLFLGLTANPAIRIDPSSSNGHQLKAIATLKDLEIHFRNPYPKYGRDANDDPWKRFTSHLSDSGQILMTENYSCYKTIVDWIMVFMFPFIKDISKLRLTGCIKTSVKNKWSYILSNKFTHGYDISAERASILALPESSLPPVCSCPQTCYPYGKFANLYDFDHDDAYVPGTCSCERAKGSEHHGGYLIDGMHSNDCRLGLYMDRTQVEVSTKAGIKHSGAAHNNNNDNTLENENLTSNASNDITTAGKDDLGPLTPVIESRI